MCYFYVIRVLSAGGKNVIAERIRQLNQFQSGNMHLKVKRLQIAILEINGCPISIFDYYHLNTT